MNHLQDVNNLLQELEHVVYQLKQYDIRKETKEAMIFAKIMHNRKLYWPAAANQSTTIANLVKENMRRDLYLAQKLLYALSSSKNEGMWKLVLLLLSILAYGGLLLYFMYQKVTN